MMKYTIIVFLIIIAIVIGLFFKDKNKPTLLPNIMTSLKNDEEIQQVKITAEFKIITNGTTRVFTDQKYHNLSDSVFIEAPNPNIVNVSNKGITWFDFFKTLPMSLDKKCLVTGTKQTFCTGNGKFLKFFLNGTENPNTLDEIISDYDVLLVEYK